MHVGFAGQDLSGQLVSPGPVTWTWTWGFAKAKNGVLVGQAPRDIGLGKLSVQRHIKQSPFHC